MVGSVDRFDDIALSNSRVPEEDLRDIAVLTSRSNSSLVSDATSADAVSAHGPQMTGQKAYFLHLESISPDDLTSLTFLPQVHHLGAVPSRRASYSPRLRCLPPWVIELADKINW